MPHTATVQGVGVSIDEAGMGAPAVILEARDERLPIFISAGQAQSIQLAHHGIPMDRPLTHDILVEIVSAVGGVIDGVRIDDLGGTTFYAKLDLELAREGEDDPDRLVFDIRPSDGIALALRVGCPITVTDEVLDAAGHPPDDITIGEDAASDIDLNRV